MLFKIIDNIRTRPKHVRDQYAFLIAVFCTLMIGGIWSLSLPARFAGGSQVAALASTTNAVPFANFFTQLKNQFAGIGEAIEELPKTASTSDSIASTTQSALDLQLSPENKEQIRASATDTKIEFGTSSTASAGQETANKTILVGTTSAAQDSVR